jgi:ribosomal protein S18 acetylase RimI-like enzyme
MIKIVQLKKAKASVLVDIRGLLAQVRTGPAEHPASMAELKSALEDKNTLIVVAKDGVRIVGIALLCITMRIGRRTGQVEDVVVDNEYRGKGIGKTLMQELINLARKKKLKEIYLTSRPARVAANALYQKMGFIKKETNAYCLKLSA